MSGFKLKSDYVPRGDQGAAIDELTQGLLSGERAQTLLGVTGSGKTYTIANVIARANRPALVLSHNKTLVAQLYGEFRALFPDNAVEFFISYYDYYQPEAYVPSTDTFIEKDADVNEEIDRLRLRATSSLLERRDVIIVSSVSCIYGLGSPQEYEKLHVILNVGDQVDRDEVIRNLVDIHYARSDFGLERSNFRVRGDVLEIMPAYDDRVIRIEFFGDVIEGISEIHRITGKVVDVRSRVAIYPAKHFVTTRPRIESAIEEIQKDLDIRVSDLERENKLVEAQRLSQRTRFDIEMLREIGYCSGIENYSRYLTGRAPGEKPWVLLDYFPDDFIMVIDESHVTLPQVRGMYNGDRSRKETLVEYGFRLPSALDNRPLNFEEFERSINQVIYVSATPADYELEQCKGVVVEQIIRPTGLIDPKIIVKPAAGQVDDLLGEIRKRVAENERVLITTLTKKMSEDLTDYLLKMGVRVRYLHSEIESLERVEILRGLRLKEFDVIVGVNLLREGLDLPEVSLVAILDADKQGFLRNERSLIQTAGRAARNVNGLVIFYADTMTDAMRRTIEETNRRRTIQTAYNVKHGITPESIIKSIDDILSSTVIADGTGQTQKVNRDEVNILDLMDSQEALAALKKQMKAAADKLEFEEAARLRDEILRIETSVPGEKRKI
ncbi:MAG: excinuclease ABC subunit UvrB [Candidatus Latescibacteria bacterium]|nr:excinuclease ABC subunit UvrB [Candidatus Latescibacterota bacterium]